MAGNIYPIETTVKTYERQSVDGVITVAITKGDVILIVAQRNHMMYAYNTKYDVISYVFEGHDSKEAYEKTLHFIGKMVLKGNENKYFDKPIYKESCINGKPGSMSRADWNDFVHTDVQLYL